MLLNQIFNVVYTVFLCGVLNMLKDKPCANSLVDTNFCLKLQSKTVSKTRFEIAPVHQAINMLVSRLPIPPSSVEQL